MFIREPSFNKPADRHAAKLPRVPKEVSLLILLSLVTSHGIMSNSGDPVVAYCTPRQGAAAKEGLNTAGGFLGDRNSIVGAQQMNANSSGKGGKTCSSMMDPTFLSGNKHRIFYTLTICVKIGSKRLLGWHFLKNMLTSSPAKAREDRCQFLQ